MRLQERVCIITGGGRGLGRERALGFAREGARVVVAGTSEAALQQTAVEIRCVRLTRPRNGACLD